MKILLIVAWALWAVLVSAALYGVVATMLERQSAPEVGSGFGLMVTIPLLAVVLALGALLYWLQGSGSQTGMIVLTALMALPVALMVARPLVLGFNDWRFAQEASRVGDFGDPVARAIAAAVREGDSAALAQRLAAGAPLRAKDRAGNDLLAFALIALMDGNTTADCIRALLDAGYDPRLARTARGEDPLNALILGANAEVTKAYRFLIERGADPNAVDPVTGDTPLANAGSQIEIVRALVDAGAEMDRIQPDGTTALIRFVAARHWGAAIFLVERGARLDIESANGLSLGYYDEKWAAMYGAEAVEGWTRLQRALEKRRAAVP